MMNKKKMMIAMDLSVDEDEAVDDDPNSEIHKNLKTQSDETMKHRYLSWIHHLTMK